MDISNSIDLVRTDYTEVGHPDSFWVALLDQREHVHFVGISWKLLADSGQPEVVDHVDQL